MRQLWVIVAIEMDTMYVRNQTVHSASRPNNVIVIFEREMKKRQRYSYNDDIKNNITNKH